MCGHHGAINPFSPPPGNAYGTYNILAVISKQTSVILPLALLINVNKTNDK